MLSKTVMGNMSVQLPALFKQLCVLWAIWHIYYRFYLVSPFFKNVCVCL